MRHWVGRSITNSMNLIYVLPVTLLIHGSKLLQWFVCHIIVSLYCGTNLLQGRTNLPPEKVPWDALVTLLSQSIYGGKIDNDFDQRLLQSFLSKLFTPKSFESDFALVSDIDGGGSRNITMPDGTRRDHFLKWIEALADRQTPSWLGLPNNAEKVQTIMNEVL